MLRVDTHTATKARVRFARICVQIDVKKPLVTTILIGKFEQPVSYEGIQKLCFGCGRMGHRRKGCPYTIHRSTPSREPVLEAAGKNENRACKTHEADSVKADAGPSAAMQEDVHEKV